MINEIPAPYQTLAGSFTADALKAKGMTLTSKETIDFNNAKATFIQLTQAANGTIFTKQILIFGDEKTTVLVNGIYPETLKEIEGQIKKSLLSAVYNPSQDENPLEAAAFTIEVSDTDFKLVKYLSGSLLYSTDGKIPTDKPTLIIANSIAKIPLQNQQKYAEDRLKKLPGAEDYLIKAMKEITIDNLNGYEIIAEGKTKDNKPGLLYQVMLFNDKGDYYLIVGQATEDLQKNLEAYTKIAKTFKRK